MSAELVSVEKELPQAAPAITPMQMIEMAVKQGADIDKLSKLMDLQDRWEQNEARKAYIAAISKFKADPPKIVKDKAVSFGAGKTSYKHATLDKASEAIGTALAEVGISHRWEVHQKEGGLVEVTCILTHTLGHSERVTMQATPDSSGSKNAIQAVGSTCSYLQRYTLLSAVGLAPKDADDDGRQGGKMPEPQVTDFEAAIESIADLKSWQALWADILAASTKAGDVAAHEHLRALMVAKRKGLK